MPLTLPYASTEPIAVLLLLQVPPGMASVKVTCAPWHTVPGPLIVPTEVEGFMVNVTD